MKQPIKITIDDLEATAKDAFNSISKYTIKRKLLIVEIYINADNKYEFEYRWNGAKVSRKFAENILALQELTK